MGCSSPAGAGPATATAFWFRELSREIRWHDLDELMTIDNLSGRYLPASLRDIPPEALRAGHGGGDYFEVLDFVRAVRGEIPCPIGIDAAMDMTLPGLYSQQSIAQHGDWLSVPDSRSWTETGPYIAAADGLAEVPPRLPADPTGAGWL